MTSLSQELMEFNELCRICANKTDILLALNIFEGDGCNKAIYKKINECLPIKVEMEDKLPKLICEECVYKLDLLNEFRDISCKTEVFLSDLLNRIFVSVEQNDEPLLDSQCTSLVVPGNLHVLEGQDKSQRIDASQFNTVGSSLHPNELNDTIGVKTDSNNKVESITINGSTYNTYIVSTEPLHNTYFFCVLCSKTFADKNSFDSHCADTHWNKCEQCSLLFTSQEAYSIHCNEIHPENKQCPPKPDVNFILTHMENYRDLPQQAIPNTLVGPLDADLNDEYTTDQVLTGDTDEKPLVNRTENNGNEGERLESNGTLDDDYTDEQHLSDGGMDVEHAEEEQCETEEKSKKAKYKCTLCNQLLSSMETYKSHVTSHHNFDKKPFQCFKCDKRYRSKIGLEQHEATHTGQFDFECDSCGKGFQCKSYLIVHQRVHSTAKPFVCQTCKRTFKSKQSLVDHENRHMGVKPYTCDVCGRGFITKGLCKSHQKIHTGGDNRQHPCPVCKKLFVSKSYLNIHVRIHTGEKPFICEHCDKGFLTNIDLKIHNTMHTGEKSFVCETCGKAFARRAALRCHTRSHTGERPYRCNICGQSFTQFTPMVIHKRLHTGERPYPCDVCNEAFVSRSTMLTHQRKHESFCVDPDSPPPGECLDEENHPQ